MERLAYRPLRGSFRLAPLISAIGMSIFLQNYVQLLQGANVKPLPPVIKGGLIFDTGGFPIRIGYIQITIILLTVILMIAFSYLIGRTWPRARACQQDLVMAGLCGVNVDAPSRSPSSWARRSRRSPAAMATLYHGVIDFFIGFLAGIKAFTAAVLGGIGSIPGAMLGGLLLGMVEAFWSGYFSSEYKDVAAFALLVLVLIFLPTGLLGKPEIEKV